MLRHPSRCCHYYCSEPMTCQLWNGHSLPIMKDNVDTDAELFLANDISKEPNKLQSHDCIVLSTTTYHFELLSLVVLYDRKNYFK